MHKCIWPIYAVCTYDNLRLCMILWRSNTNNRAHIHALQSVKNEVTRLSEALNKLK